MKATIDMPKLERSLRRYGQAFGDTSAQAVVRWSVQTCRELGFEAQVFGKTKTKEKQIKAITTGALVVILVTETATKTAKGWKCKNSQGTFYASNRKFLTSPASVNSWIDQNQSGSKGRTKKLAPEDRKVCTRKVFSQAIKIRSKRAGMAKGGWLGAGKDIANAQTGMDRVSIGKNYLGYAQTAGSKFGSARKPAPGFNPAAFVTNSVSHVSSPHVMKRSAYDKALGFGLKKTLTWYRKAIKALDRKKL